MTGLNEQQLPELGVDFILYTTKVLAKPNTIIK